MLRSLAVSGVSLWLALACGGLGPVASPPRAEEAGDEVPPPISHEQAEGEADPLPPSPGRLGSVALLEDVDGACRLAIYEVGVEDTGATHRLERVVTAVPGTCGARSWSADRTFRRGWIWTPADDGGWRFDGDRGERVSGPFELGCRVDLYADASDGTSLAFASYCPTWETLGVHPSPPTPESDNDEEEVGAAVAMRREGDHWAPGSARGVAYGPVASLDACLLPELAQVDGFVSWPGCGRGWVGLPPPAVDPAPAPPTFPSLEGCGHHVEWSFRKLPGGTVGLLASADDHHALEVGAFQPVGGEWKELDRCRPKNNSVGAAWSAAGKVVAMSSAGAGGQIWWLREGMPPAPVWTPREARSVVWLGDLPARPAP